MSMEHLDAIRVVDALSAALIPHRCYISEAIRAHLVAKLTRGGDGNFPVSEDVQLRLLPRHDPIGLFMYLIKDGVVDQGLTLAVAMKVFLALPQQLPATSRPGWLAASEIVGVLKQQGIVMPMAARYQLVRLLLVPNQPFIEVNVVIPRVRRVLIHHPDAEPEWLRMHRWNVTPGNVVKVRGPSKKRRPELEGLLNQEVLAIIRKHGVTIPARPDDDTLMPGE